MKKIYSLCLIAMMLIANIVPVAEAQVFEDVAENNEAYESIGLLANLGIIQGVGDNKFAPELDVKRADFVIMLSKVLSVEAEGNAKFPDVLSGDYFYEQVMNAANAGIISGYTDGTFAPYNSITMQEAVKMSISAYEKISGKVMQVSDSEIADNADLWARAVCDKAATANMIDESFDARKVLTRAEAAQMLSGLLLYSSEGVESDFERETKIVQKQRGNIYTDLDPTPEIEVQTGYPIIETVAKDFWGNAVVHRYDKVLNGSVNLKFENLDFGHYYVDIYGRDDNGNRSLLADTTISCLKKFEAAPPSENPLGVNFHSTRSSTGWYPDLLYEASLIGVRHVRDEWYWSSVEKEKGVYTNFLQGLSDNCKKYGIALEPVCAFYSPFYDGGVRPYTDEGRTGYANVVNSFYDIFDDRELFSRVEMYNEWWNPNTAKGSPAGYEDLSYLRKLQEKTQEIVKEKHPEAILLGMLRGYPGGFTENYYKAGCVESADELSIHTYPPLLNAKEASAGARPECVPEQQIDDLFKYCCDMTKEYSGKELGKDIKWGFTETGYAVDYVHQTERYQGINYPRLLVAILHYNPEYLHTYDFLCDGNNELYKENNFGMINAQNSKHGSYTGRPAYVAFGVTSRMIDNKDGIAKEYKDNVYHYTFSKDDKTLHTFNVGHYDNKLIAINTDAPLTVTDCMGVSRVFKPYNGKIYLTASEDITYVEGNINSWNVTDNVDFEVSKPAVLGAEIFLRTDENALGIEGLKYEVEGVEYTNDEIIASASFDKEERIIRIFAKHNGEYVAQFNKVLMMDDKYSLDTEFELVKEGNTVTPQIKATIKNNSDTEILVNSIRYTVEGNIYEEPVNRTLAVGEKAEVIIRSDIFEMYSTYEIQFRVVTNGILSSFIDSDKKDVFAPLQRKTMVIDGVIDDDIGILSATDFGEKYNLWQTGSLLWEGAEDFSGYGWVSYDDENLYAAYKIIDDVHHQDNAITRSWAQDCIQIGFYHEDYEKYDIDYDATQVMPNLYWIYDLSLNSSTGEKQLYKSKVLQVGEDPYLCEGVDLEIKRNEKDKTTVYEIAIPWKTLKLDVKDLDYYRIEVAIQDADEGERSNAYYLTGDAVHLTKNRFNFLKHIIIE